MVNGYSKAKIEKLCQSLGIPYSEDALVILEEDGKMQSISIFVSTGIDLKGYKHILGYWVMKGRENVGFWAEVL